MPTKIPWADESWNPVRGCTEISEGCKHCYARAVAEGRLRGKHGYDNVDPFAVTFIPKRLDMPLHWRKPRRIFVNSMGDLFHEDVEVEWQRAVWSVMDRCPQHTFFILTKRPLSIPTYSSLRSSVFIPNIWPYLNL